MAAETAATRIKTRRVKDHILDRFLSLADKVDKKEELDRADKQVYNDLLMTFAKNVLPRSVEHGGDPENETPIPILMRPDVPTHPGDPKGSQAPETD